MMNFAFAQGQPSGSAVVERAVVVLGGPIVSIGFTDRVGVDQRCGAEHRIG